MNQVTAVIPAYNRASLVFQSIHSALAQTCSPLEVIVVDDGSTDATSDLVTTFRKSDPRVRLVRQSANHGPAAARNRGVNEARGDFVAFLDSDDTWTPTHVEESLAFFRAHPDFDVVFGDLRSTTTNGRTLETFELWNRRHIGSYFERDPLNSDWFLCRPPQTKGMFQAFLGAIQTTVMRRSLSLSHPFDADLRCGEDYALFLELACSGRQFGFLKTIHCERRFHEANLVSGRPEDLKSCAETRKMWERILVRRSIDSKDRALVRKNIAAILFDEGYLHARAGHPVKACRKYLSSFALQPAFRPLKAMAAGFVTWPFSLEASCTGVGTNELDKPLAELDSRVML